MQQEWIEVDERLKFKLLDDGDVQIEFDENTLTQEKAELIVKEILDEVVKRLKNQEKTETSL